MKFSITLLILSLPILSFSQIHKVDSSLSIVKQIKLIPCSQAKLRDTRSVKNVLDSFMNPDSIKEEVNIPPRKKAVERLNEGVTIRYFDQVTHNAAIKLQKKLMLEFKGQRMVYLEDMRPYYSKPLAASLTHYLEIWIK